MYITLEEARKHLNIDSLFVEDDAYIVSLIKVAEEAVAHNLNMNDLIVGGEIPPTIKHSVLLLVGNLYANREATTYSSISEIPFSYKYLINLNRNFEVR